MEKDKMVPVQIIGTQRSGSNLLRLMLSQLDGVFAPHPPHILSTFYPLLSAYGDLEDNDNFNALIEDVCILIELNPVPWDNLCLDRDLIFQESKNRSLSEIFRVVYTQNARARNAKYWICKSMQNVRFLPYLNSNGLKPKIIYLVRDGRDVALSFKKAIVGPKHMYSIAQKWREEQERSLEIMQNANASEAIQLDYESLLKDPESHMRNVCEFLDLKYNSKMLNFYDSMESLKTAQSGEMWNNLAKPIIKGNFNKYKQELSHEEIALFEREAGTVLERLGYNLQYKKDLQVDPLSSETILRYEQINLGLMEKAKRLASHDDLKKREAQHNFISQLKRRLKIKVA